MAAPEITVADVFKEDWTANRVVNGILNRLEAKDGKFFEDLAEHWPKYLGPDLRVAIDRIVEELLYLSELPEATEEEEKGMLITDSAWQAFENEGQRPEFSDAAIEYRRRFVQLHQKRAEVDSKILRVMEQHGLKQHVGDAPSFGKLAQQLRDSSNRLRVRKIYQRAYGVVKDIIGEFREDHELLGRAHKIMTDLEEDKWLWFMVARFVEAQAAN